MTGVLTAEVLTGETVELLQAMIRNKCVNDGTAESGYETRNADLLRTYLGSTGLDLQGFEPTAGRASLVARIEGSDPDRAEPVPDGSHRCRAGQRERMVA